jgi:hypothetical protein
MSIMGIVCFSVEISFRVFSNRDILVPIKKPLSILFLYINEGCLWHRFTFIQWNNFPSHLWLISKMRGYFLGYTCIVIVVFISVIVYFN